MSDLDMNPSMDYPHALAQAYILPAAQGHYVAQQDGPSYDFQWTPPAPQMQLQAEQFATFESHAPYPPQPSLAIPGHGYQDMGDASNAQIAPTLPMGPPARPRKRKAPTLRAGDWEPYKAQIIELHITQGLPLKEVRERMEKGFGFSAEYVALIADQI